MCTAVLSLEPGRPALVAAFRDEFVDRAWQPPGRHWPTRPDLVGGRDLLAGGTWLAVHPAARRLVCVLNGRGRPAPARSRRSRGELPLAAAQAWGPTRGTVRDFDPFHLLVVEPESARLWSWDGTTLAGRDLAAGLHIVVNDGLADPRATPGGHSRGLARAGHFLPLLRAAERPDPFRCDATVGAWGRWLPLVDGGGLPPGDPRALVVRRAAGDGRCWATTSVTLVALTADRLRYDFNGTPGDPVAWRTVAVGGTAPALAPRTRPSVGPTAHHRTR